MKLRHAVLGSLLPLSLAACGSSSSNNNTGTTPAATTYTWAANVSTIVTKDCNTGTGCHGASPGAGATPYATQAAFVADKTGILAQVGSAMPPAPATISATDKSTITSYLGQTNPN